MRSRRCRRRPYGRRDARFRWRRRGGRGERLGEAGGDLSRRRGRWRGRSSRLYSPFWRCGEPVAGTNDKRETAQPRFHGRVAGDRARVHGTGLRGGRRIPGAAAGGRERLPGPPTFRWFCLDHVRAFNARYNFFDGMTADEIHHAQRPLAGWERETRAFAHAGATAAALDRLLRSARCDRGAVPPRGRAGARRRQAAVGAGPREPEGAGARRGRGSRGAEEALFGAGAEISSRSQWRRSQPRERCCSRSSRRTSSCGRRRRSFEGAADGAFAERLPLHHGLRPRSPSPGSGGGI